MGTQWGSDRECVLRTCYVLGRVVMGRVQMERNLSLAWSLLDWAALQEWTQLHPQDMVLTNWSLLLPSFWVLESKDLCFSAAPLVTLAVLCFSFFDSSLFLFYLSASSSSLNLKQQLPVSALFPPNCTIYSLQGSLVGSNPHSCPLTLLIFF